MSHEGGVIDVGGGGGGDDGAAVTPPNWSTPPTSPPHTASGSPAAAPRSATPKKSGPLRLGSKATKTPSPSNAGRYKSGDVSSPSHSAAGSAGAGAGVGVGEVEDPKHPASFEDVQDEGEGEGAETRSVLDALSLKVLIPVAILLCAGIGALLMPDYSRNYVVIENRRGASLVLEPDANNYVVLKERRLGNRVQKWKLGNDGYLVNRLDGLVASVDNNGAVFLSPTASDQNHRRAQQWDIDEDGQIVNRNSGGVLHVQGNNLVVCRGREEGENKIRQQWTFTDEGYIMARANFSYMLHVDTYTDPGNVVVWERQEGQQFGERFSSHQLWSVRSNGMIESVHLPGHVLSVNALHSVRVQPVKDNAKDKDNAGQSWIIKEDGYIRSKMHPMLVLDADDRSNVVIWDKKSGHNLNQKWTLQPV